MPGSVTHIAIADKINTILGDGVIKNLPLFYGGVLAPDAVHAKKDYSRADKKHSHLCDGIRSYGYGYPEKARLFIDRINEFIEKYYMVAGEDKDLYFGYVIHLLTDEFYLLSVYKQLEDNFKKEGFNPDETGFRKKLADEINDDPQMYNAKYIDFFSETSRSMEISANNYHFKNDVIKMLEAVWDYEVKDYINANEINISKRWVINNYKNEIIKNGDDDHEIKIDDSNDVDTVKAPATIEIVENYVDIAANNIINRLSCKDGLVRSCFIIN